MRDYLEYFFRSSILTFLLSLNIYFWFTLLKFLPTRPYGPSWSSSRNISTYFRPFVRLQFFIGLSLALRSHDQIPSTNCGINTLNKCYTLLLALRSHDQIPSTHCDINTLKKDTLNYWPSDHMIGSQQPLVASVP